jgi:hypothetical protein
MDKMGKSRTDGSLYIVGYGDSTNGTFGIVVRARARSEVSALERAGEILTLLCDHHWQTMPSEWVNDAGHTGCNIWEHTGTGESVRVYISIPNIDRALLTVGGIEIQREK